MFDHLDRLTLHHPIVRKTQRTLILTVIPLMLMVHSGKSHENQAIAIPLSPDQHTSVYHPVDPSAPETASINGTRYRLTVLFEASSP